VNQQEPAPDPLRKFAMVIPPLMELRKRPRRYFTEQGHNYERVIRRIDRYDALFTMYYQKNDEDKINACDNRRINRLQRRARAFVLDIQRTSPTV
jgi:hypothetical protein